MALDALFSVPHSQSGLLTRIASDYCNDDSFFHALRSTSPLNPNFEALIAQRQSFDAQKRNVLVDVLKNQYAATGILNAASESIINKLLKPTTFTVTTGQQVGILLGPLYTPLKILSAVALCVDLKNKYADKDFIPVFWMATEDHDIDEIRSFTIHGKKYTCPLQYNGPAGRMPCAAVLEWLQQSDVFSIIPNWRQLLTDAYSLPTLAMATRYLVHHIFGQLGLLCIDADDVQLKSSFASIIEDDILNSRSYTLSRNAIDTISHRYPVQLQGRDINFFYLKDNYRERIEKDTEGFKTTDQSYTWEANSLKTEIRLYPERFSPNALMRPVYQEFILPNIATFGGAAEIAYWLELKSVMEHYSVVFPALLLRNSAVLMDGASFHRLENSGFIWADLLLPLIEIERRKLLSDSQGMLDLSNELEAFDTMFKSIEEKATAVNLPTKRSARAMQVRLKKQLENFQKKMLREARKKEAERLGQIRSVYATVFPTGALSERSESLFTFMSSAHSRLFKTLLAAMSPNGNLLIMCRWNDDLS
ncbi:MAG: bacillithiol biosynthesis cysteine-adding enzyme BshC [Bacteroidia bacterium]